MALSIVQTTKGYEVRTLIDEIDEDYPIWDFLHLTHTKFVEAEYRTLKIHKTLKSAKKHIEQLELTLGREIYRS